MRLHGEIRFLKVSSFCKIVEIERSLSCPAILVSNAPRGRTAGYTRYIWNKDGRPVTVGARSRRSYDKNMDRDSLWWNWLVWRKLTVPAIWFSEQHREIEWGLVWTISYKSLWLWAQRVVTLGPDHNCTGTYYVVVNIIIVVIVIVIQLLVRINHSHMQ